VAWVVWSCAGLHVCMHVKKTWLHLPSCGGASCPDRQGPPDPPTPVMEGTRGLHEMLDPSALELSCLSSAAVQCSCPWASLLRMPCSQRCPYKWSRPCSVRAGFTATLGHGRYHAHAAHTAHPIAPARRPSIIACAMDKSTALPGIGVHRPNSP
jgi:hypothetical protein